MNKIVTKFGGSSLANSNQFKKVKNILFENDNRKYCVVSASGKRNKDDDKITDLLLSLHDKLLDSDASNRIIDILKTRYLEIVNELNIDFDIEGTLNEIINVANKQSTPDYLASRGEYISAKLLSLYTDSYFLDTKDIIIFNDDHKIDYDLTYTNIKNAINQLEQDNPSKKIIIPGFYGSNKSGEIKIFSRGGSDITGSLVARALNAKVYENWTDVSGVYFEDPRLGVSPNVIKYITYTELRELSYMGASVLHEASIFPVSQVGIPINIKNTNSPQDDGTMIVSNIPSFIKRNPVTGVAGKKHFSSIHIQKALMNEEIGFLSKLLKIFEDEKISVEHCPTGIDTISIILKTELLENKKDTILNRINKTLSPDILHVDDNMSIIAIVGEGMKYSKRIILKVFEILSDNDIQVKMIDQGASGINIIIGIDDNDYDKAITALCSLQDFT